MGNCKRCAYGKSFSYWQKSVREASGMLRENYTSATLGHLSDMRFYRASVRVLLINSTHTCGK